ncbi:MAG: hypothetical protein COX81_00970 [Candidatus Magasanikbacteria bacterium CG_4_10_14_0_2_um_filter_37_12]|uniref:RCK N-terminal domain-containing protein n=1 Tax=Candidatus Magasanikbacteria bacterium CG_4_10_14_0_2_um_filter_37_12 TaxID=1974637 RepID=A0A2M7V973_9BACT|nr:MAG: hypothetical protein COX81_00970 [Candidatus Magasanikbacteria bacterium CG_4_10_14_0_2_um_filter_37_12]
MTTMENIFLQISIVLGVTVSIAFVMRMLRQPLIVGYIVAGLIAGPLFLDVIHGGDDLFEAFAQFGIVLLLFVVGLSLNFQYIRRVGKAVLICGLTQFFITVLVGLGLMHLMNFSFISSLFVAIAISFSSTIVVIKLLSEKEDLESMYGKFVIGLLIVQDLIAIIVMIFLNTAYIGSSVWYETLVIIFGKGLLLSWVVFLLAKFVLPLLVEKVAKSSEFLFVFTIAWCFGVASLVYWSGFSIEIGAIIAGVSLGASQYQQLISSRIRPLRDFFIVLFFIVLGSELQLADITIALKPALILSIFILVVDPFILYFVMRKLRYTRRNSFLAGITAAQISEFGFILTFKGQEVGLLYGSELAILAITALVTITISSYLIEYNEQIYQSISPFIKKFGKKEKEDKEEKKKIYDVWVFGYHRIGWKICEALKEKGVSFAVVDFNPDIIDRLKHRGINCYFGDAADVEFLEGLSLEKSKMVISTIPEPDDQLTLVKHIRKMTKKTLIIANLYHNTFLDDLYEAGTDYVMMPHLLGGRWISDILKNYAWTSQTLKDLKKEQRREMKLRFTVGTYEQ